MTTKTRQTSPLIPEAVCLIAERLGCTQDEALERLRTRTEFGQYRLHDYARLVLDGVIRFDT